MKKFLAGTIGVLSTIAVAGGALAIHNKVSEKKITIKRGDAVWIGDETKKEEPIVVKPSEEEISAMDKYCQANHCMLVNLMYIGDSNVDSYLINIPSADQMFDLMTNNQVMNNIYFNEPHATVLGVAKDASGTGLITREELNENAADLFEEKYVEMYVIVDNSPKATFYVNGQSVMSADGEYFKTKEDGTLNYPEDPEAPAGYTFDGWSTIELLPPEIVDKATYKPEGLVNLYAIFTHDETGQPYDYRITINFHRAANSIAPWVDGSGSDSIDCSMNITMNLGTTFEGLTFVGWSDSPEDVNNLREDMIFHRDGNHSVYAVYEDSNGTRYKFNEVKFLSLYNPQGMPTEYAYTTSQIELLKTALNEKVSSSGAVGLTVNLIDILDINAFTFDNLEQAYWLKY